MKIDPTRATDYADQTGIVVRAQDEHGRWMATDIGTLDMPSLVAWLKEHPDRATQVVLLLLGYPVKVSS